MPLKLRTKATVVSHPLVRVYNINVCQYNFSFSKLFYCYTVTK